MFNKETHPLNNLKFLEKKEDWINLPIKLNEKKLIINGHPVMEDWEKPYMKELAKIVTYNKGRILEIGFGMGISAGYIQEFNPKEHHIIEANKEVAINAKKFSKFSKNKIIVKRGFWEDISVEYPNEYFDGILFDTYPILESELHTARFDFFDEAYRLLKKDGIFTHYLGEIEISNNYKDLILKTGFKRVEVVSINVTPPKDTLYWEDTNILAPIIYK